MTFPADPGRWTFTASGSSGSFNVNAPVYDAAALGLYAVDGDDIIYEPAFTVTLATDRSGATVAVASGLTSGDRVIVHRVPKLTQLEPLPASGPLPAKLVGRQLDRAFADLVAHDLMVRRAIRAPLADDDNLDELPTAALRANGIVGFDALGALAVIFQVPLSPAVNVSAFMQTLLLAASAGAVRNSLGFSAWFQTLIATTDAATLATAIGAEDLRTALDVERANGKSIWGLTWAKNGANTIDLAAGGAMSDDGATWLAYAGGTALAIDTLFAGGGTLDTGAIGNSDYYLWLVSNGTLVKPLTSLSATAPAMPSGYTEKRLAGWFKRSAGAIVAFKTYELPGGGIEFKWTDPREDVRLSGTLTSTRRTDALSVPLDFPVLALITPSMYDTGGLSAARICCPDEADAAVYTPNGLYTTGARNANMFAINATMMSFGDLRIRTDATGKIAARSSAGITVDMYVVQTNGFEWSRR